MNCLLADNSHEMSSLILSEKITKSTSVLSAVVVISALMVNHFRKSYKRKPQLCIRESVGPSFLNPEGNPGALFMNLKYIYP